MNMATKRKNQRLRKMLLYQEYILFCLKRELGLLPEGIEMEPQEHIEQFFAYDHLPAHLQEVSKPFALLAETVLQLPRNPERTVALRKLLEAKDAAVRAKLAKAAPPPPPPSDR